MKKITTLLLLCFISQLAFSQTQYGHLNYGTLLSVMPETKQADETLAAYQKELEDNLRANVDAFKKRYIEANTQVQKGELSPKAMAELEKEMKDKESVLKFEEYQISEKMTSKRQALLAPIIERAKVAIDAVAKERNISMIFDVSIFNAILSVTDETDMMPFVLAKLGIDYNK